MDIWEKLKQSDNPIVLYGTGNGAEKIYAELEKRGIEIAGVFASDDFVRNKEFAGFPVTDYASQKETFGTDMTVLVCFGSDRRDVIAKIRELAEEQNLLFPDVPVIPGECFDGAYFAAHSGDLELARASLADDMSRRVFDEVIAYKLSGEIDHLFACETDAEEPWDLLDLSGDEIYLDLGAYTGDTVSAFLNGVWRNAPDAVTATFRTVICLEPDARNFRKLNEAMHRLQDIEPDAPLPEGIELHNKAVSDSEGTIFVEKNAGRGSGTGSGESGTAKKISVETATVDGILAGRSCTVIKMDVEGAESAAIRGAEETIRRWKPRMIIAGYHRSEDLFAIPLQVLKLNPEYKVYLRHSPCLPAWEVNYIFV